MEYKRQLGSNGNTSMETNGHKSIKNKSGQGWVFIGRVRPGALQSGMIYCNVINNHAERWSQLPRENLLSWDIVDDMVLRTIFKSKQKTFGYV